MPCPSYTPEAIHFWFLWHNPFRVHLLEQFEKQEIVMRTGHNLLSPRSKEVKVLLPFHALSKVCSGCGKWEQLEAPDEGGVRSYSRLKRCQGCRQSFFCGKKCQISILPSPSPFPHLHFLLLLYLTREQMRGRNTSPIARR